MFYLKILQGILKHHPIEELYRQSGPYPGPLDEENLWSKRLDSLHSINAQLDSAVAQDILRNLEEANSTYASSFQIVRKDITKVIIIVIIVIVMQHLYCTLFFLFNILNIYVLLPICHRRMLTDKIM